MTPGTTADVLSAAHRQYLNDHAVSDPVISGAGVFSNGDEIIFPWRDGNLITAQRRRWPDPPGGPGEVKYLWEAGRTLHLWAVRPVADENQDGPVLLVEGTKQVLAVASWAS